MTCRRGIKWQAQGLKDLPEDIIKYILIYQPIVIVNIFDCIYRYNFGISDTIFDLRYEIQRSASILIKNIIANDDDIMIDLERLQHKMKLRVEFYPLVIMPNKEPTEVVYLIDFSKKEITAITENYHSTYLITEHHWNLGYNNSYGHIRTENGWLPNDYINTHKKYGDYGYVFDTSHRYHRDNPLWFVSHINDIPITIWDNYDLYNRARRLHTGNVIYRN